MAFAWCVIHNKPMKKTLNTLYSLFAWEEESIQGEITIGTENYKLKKARKQNLEEGHARTNDGNKQIGSEEENDHKIKFNYLFEFERLSFNIFIYLETGVKFPTYLYLTIFSY